MKAVSFIVCLLIGVVVQAAELPMQTAVLRGVDKITGRVSTMYATVGEEITFGHLIIGVEKCFTRSPEETPENSAFLNIAEKKTDGSIADVFTGWMFSSNPALSAMEHAGYDVWVIGCQEGATSQENVVPFNEAEKGNQPDDSDMVADEDNPALGEE